VLRLLLRVLVGLGWIVLLVGALALGLEHSGIARSYVEHLAAARLASLGGEVRIGALDVHWLARAVVARDVRLDDERELVRLDSVRFDVRFGANGPTLERVSIDGGRLFLTPGLYRGARGLLDERREAQEDREPTPPALFEIFVADF